MIVRRTLEGALKCALRDFLRDEWRAVNQRGVNDNYAPKLLLKARITMHSYQSLF